MGWLAMPAIMPSKMTFAAAMPPKTVAALMCAGLLLLGRARAADTVVDLQLSLGHDSAVNQSSWEPKQSQVQGLELALSRSGVIDDNSGWVLRGRLAIERNVAYQQLNNVALGLSAVYRVQPTVGFSEPWFELEASGLARQYSDSALRDGSQLGLSALLGQRFTDRLRGRAGVGWQRRWARQDEVFNLTDQRAFADLGWRLGDDNLLFVRLERVWGDQVFGGDPPLKAGDLVPSWWSDSYAKASAAKLDPIFADDSWSYRTQAAVSTLTLGMNVPLNGSTALSFGVDRALISAQGGSRYDRTQVSAAILYRF
jgi:hypothetical protein